MQLFTRVPPNPDSLSFPLSFLPFQPPCRAPYCTTPQKQQKPNQERRKRRQREQRPKPIHTRQQERQQQRKQKPRTTERTTATTTARRPAETTTRNGSENDSDNDDRNSETRTTNSCSGRIAREWAHNLMEGSTGKVRRRAG